MVENGSEGKECGNSVDSKATLQFCLVEIELLQKSDIGKNILPWGQWTGNREKKTKIQRLYQKF